MTDSFKARTALNVSGQPLGIYDLSKLQPAHDLDRLPFSLKILPQNLLRFEHGVNVTRKDIEAILNEKPQVAPHLEKTPFRPTR